MPTNLIEPPDLLGYDQVLEGLVVDADIPSADKNRILGMLKAFTTSYRQLDSWRRKHLKAREFGVGEACFHGTAPCVVMAVTAMRVTVRRWSVPPIASEVPIVGLVKWYQGTALTKVTKREQWEQWVWSMWQSGQTAKQWTTMEILAVAQ